MEGGFADLIALDHLTSAEEMVVRKWLVQINEADPVTIAQVIAQCQTDPEAGNYFLKCAAETRA